MELIRRCRICWENAATRLFLSLQVGDVLTTLLFVARGIVETNPLANYFMERWGPLGGLLLLKGAALSVGLACNVAAHPRFMRGMNVAYGAIVLINILTLCNITPA
jgi:hypothetical protein